MTDDGGGEDEVVRKIESVVDSAATHHHAVKKHRVNTSYDEIVVYSDEIEDRPRRGETVTIRFGENHCEGGGGELRGVEEIREKLEEIEGKIDDFGKYNEKVINEAQKFSKQRKKALKWVLRRRDSL